MSAEISRLGFGIRVGERDMVEWALRVAVIGCFLGHGVVALQASGNFASEWSAWIQGLFSGEYRYFASRVLLGTIGMVDILAALHLLLFRQPSLAVFAWTIPWALATAVSRVFFLGALTGPFWQNTVHPLGEFFVRAPNWACPIMLFCLVSPWAAKTVVAKISLRSVLKIAAACLMLGLFLNYLSHLAHPLLEYELMKVGKPLWFFHLSGVLSGVGIAAVIGSFHSNAPAWLRALFGSVVFVPVLMQEGFHFFILNLPSGLGFSLIRLIEHLPLVVVAAGVFYTTRSRADSLHGDGQRR